MTKKKAQLYNKPVKRSLSLRHFVRNLKENDLHYDNKQITQCVFLGVLRLKPVIGMFKPDVKNAQKQSPTKSAPSKAISKLKSDPNVKIVNKNEIKKSTTNKKPATQGKIVKKNAEKISQKVKNGDKKKNIIKIKLGPKKTATVKNTVKTAKKSLPLPVKTVMTEKKQTFKIINSPKKLLTSVIREEPIFQPPNEVQILMDKIKNKQAFETPKKQTKKLINRKPSTSKSSSPTLPTKIVKKSTKPLEKRKLIDSKSDTPKRSKKSLSMDPDSSKVTKNDEIILITDDEPQKPQEIEEDDVVFVSSTRSSPRLSINEEKAAEVEKAKVSKPKERTSPRNKVDEVVEPKKDVKTKKLKERTSPRNKSSDSIDIILEKSKTSEKNTKTSVEVESIEIQDDDKLNSSLQPHDEIEASLNILFGYTDSPIPDRLPMKEITPTKPVKVSVKQPDFSLLETTSKRKALKEPSPPPVLVIEEDSFYFTDDILPEKSLFSIEETVVIGDEDAPKIVESPKKSIEKLVINEPKPSRRTLLKNKSVGDAQPTEKLGSKKKSPIIIEETVVIGEEDAPKQAEPPRKSLEKLVINDPKPSRRLLTKKKSVSQPSENLVSKKKSPTVIEETVVIGEEDAQTTEKLVSKKKSPTVIQETVVLGEEDAPKKVETPEKLVINEPKPSRRILLRKKYDAQPTEKLVSKKKSPTVIEKTVVIDEDDSTKKVESPRKSPEKLMNTEPKPSIRTLVKKSDGDAQPSEKLVPKKKPQIVIEETVVIGEEDAPKKVESPRKSPEKLVNTEPKPSRRTLLKEKSVGDAQPTEKLVPKDKSPSAIEETVVIGDEDVPKKVESPRKSPEKLVNVKPKPSRRTLPKKKSIGETQPTEKLVPKNNSPAGIEETVVIGEEDSPKKVESPRKSPEQLVNTDPKPTRRTLLGKKSIGDAQPTEKLVPKDKSPTVIEETVVIGDEDAPKKVESPEKLVNIKPKPSRRTLLKKTSLGDTQPTEKLVQKNVIEETVVIEDDDVKTVEKPVVIESPTKKTSSETVEDDVLSVSSSVESKSNSKKVSARKILSKTIEDDVISISSSAESKSPKKAPVKKMLLTLPEETLVTEEEPNLLEETVVIGDDDSPKVNEEILSPLKDDSPIVVEDTPMVIPDDTSSPTVVQSEVTKVPTKKKSPEPIAEKDTPTKKILRPRNSESPTKKSPEKSEEVPTVDSPVKKTTRHKKVDKLSSNETPLVIEDAVIIGDTQTTQPSPTKKSAKKSLIQKKLPFALNKTVVGDGNDNSPKVTATKRGRKKASPETVGDKTPKPVTKRGRKKAVKETVNIGDESKTEDKPITENIPEQTSVAIGVNKTPEKQAEKPPLRRSPRDKTPASTSTTKKVDESPVVTEPKKSPPVGENKPKKRGSRKSEPLLNPASEEVKKITNNRGKKRKTVVKMEDLIIQDELEAAMQELQELLDSTADSVQEVQNTVESATELVTKNPGRNAKNKAIVAMVGSAPKKRTKVSLDKVKVEPDTTLVQEEQPKEVAKKRGRPAKVKTDKKAKITVEESVPKEIPNPSTSLDLYQSPEAIVEQINKLTGGETTISLEEVPTSPIIDEKNNQAKVARIKPMMVVNSPQKEAPKDLYDFVDEEVEEVSPLRSPSPKKSPTNAQQQAKNKGKKKKPLDFKKESLETVDLVTQKPAVKNEAKSPLKSPMRQQSIVEMFEAQRLKKQRQAEIDAIFSRPADVSQNKNTVTITAVKNESSTIVKQPLTESNSIRNNSDDDEDFYDDDSRSAMEWVPEDYAEYKIQYAEKISTQVGKYVPAFRCKVCLAIFKSYYVLRKHRKTHEQKEYPYTCPTCAESFKTVDDLNAHLRIHKGKEPYSCKKCKMGFQSKEAKEAHESVHVLKKVKVETKKFRCDVCAKEFGKVSDVERHMRVHTGEKPCVCNICHKRFQQSYNLSKHLLTHLHVKPFTCEICNKQFGRNDVMQRHLLTHSLDKPYKCTLCPKGFIRPFQLEKHLKKTHQKKPDPPHTSEEVVGEKVVEGVTVQPPPQLPSEP